LLFAVHRIAIGQPKRKMTEARRKQRLEKKRERARMRARGEGRQRERERRWRERYLGGLSGCEGRVGGEKQHSQMSSAHDRRRERVSKVALVGIKNKK
jgi:hypothetical protein